MSIRIDTLDTDLNELKTWFTSHHGVTYHISLVQPQAADPDDKAKGERYPLPNSHTHSHTARKSPMPTKHIDRAEYDERVAKLRAEHYIRLGDVAIRMGKSKEAVRADMYAGHLKAVNVMEGVSITGTRLPRYFVHPDELRRYVAWCDAGRPIANKPRPFTRRVTEDKTA
jgi:hypothetical protein